MTDDANSYSDPVFGDLELLMPFVVVESNGGPFDDSAYVAGYALGRLDLRLEMSARFNLEPPDEMIDRRNLPQLDLVAMHHGYAITERQMQLEGVEDEAADLVRSEWAHISFTRMGHA